MPDMEIDSTSAVPNRDDLNDALHEIATISEQPPREREDVTPHIAQVTAYARTYGLPNTALSTIITFILGPSRLDNASCSALISELYPADPVSSSTVQEIVAKLGTSANKAAPSVQTLFLRWLVLVEDVLEEPRAISRVYSVLFGLLDVTPLRDYLCHLLCHFTEPHHVQPFRASALKELRKTPNANEYVTSLLACYHAIRPDLIPDELCSGKVASMDCPDPAWRDRLESIQTEAIQSALSRASETQFRVAQRTVNGKRRARRHLVETDTDEGGEGLENVTGVKDFVEKLPSITRPSDMEAVLDDPLLQHYMATGPDDIGELDKEVDEILGAFFEKEAESVRNGQALSLRAVQTLKKVLEYAQFQKFLPGSAEKFITETLSSEQSEAHLGLLLELLSWKYPDSHAWNDSILSKGIEEQIMKRSATPESLLRYYTSVLRNRTAMFLSGTSAFEGTPEDAPTVLVTHTSSLAMSLLARSQSQRCISTVLNHLLALAAISKEATRENQVPIFNIEAPIVYLLLFANPAVSNISHMLSILADYKRIVEGIVGHTQSQPQNGKYPPDLIKRLNGFIMDCCNLFWRSRAFSTQTGDKNAAGCLLKTSSETELARYLQSLHSDYAMTGAFSPACHPALAGLAAAAWAELEARKLGIVEDDLVTRRHEYRHHKENGMEVDGKKTKEDRPGTQKGPNNDDDTQAVHMGPVSRASLQRLEAAGGAAVSWSQYRLSVLEWLELRGSDGISKLMKRTITLLMDKSGGKSTPGSSQASPAIVTPIDTPMTE